MPNPAPHTSLKFRVGTIVCTWLLGGTLCCAIPGTPVPPDKDDGVCPSVEIVSANADGMLLALSIPDPQVGAVVTVWRKVEDSEPVSFFELELTTRLAEQARREPLSFLDADAPAGVSTQWGIDVPGVRCPRLTASATLPTAPEPPSAPTVQVTGSTVMLEAPADATEVVRVYRRSLREQGEPDLVTKRWLTDEPWVDTTATPGDVAVYSLSNVHGEGGVERESQRGPEAYGPVTPLDQLVRPDVEEADESGEETGTGPDAAEDPEGANDSEPADAVEATEEPDTETERVSTPAETQP